MFMNTVMVLNGESRTSLPLVRSLGKSKTRVVVGGTSRLSRSFFSKYCYKSFVYRNHLGEKTLLRDIVSAIKQYSPDILFPAGSDTTRLCVMHRQIFNKYTVLVPLPSKKVFNLVDNKATLTQLATMHKLPVPYTIYPRDVKELELCKHKLPYPVIIKPTIATGSKGIQVAYDEKGLIKGYETLSRMRPGKFWQNMSEVIVQKFRPSNTTSAYVILKDGKCFAYMMMHNLIHYPHPFGPPVRNITVSHPQLKASLLKFLTKIGWEGLACISFITDPDDGQLKMIDFNPRVWGQMDASVAAGIDFPRICFLLAMGQEVIPVLDYKSGLIVSHPFGEFANALRAKHKLSLLNKYVKAKCMSNLDWSDPVPHLVHGMEYVAGKSIL